MRNSKKPLVLQSLEALSRFGKVCWCVVRDVRSQVWALVLMVKVQLSKNWSTVDDEVFCMWERLVAGRPSRRASYSERPESLNWGFSINRSGK